MSSGYVGFLDRKHIELKYSWQSVIVPMILACLHWNHLSHNLATQPNFSSILNALEFMQEKQVLWGAEILKQTGQSNL